MLREIQHWFEKKQPERWFDLPEGQLVVLWQLEPNLSLEDFQRELAVYDNRRVNDNPFDL